MTTDEVLQAVKEAGFGINHAEASAILFTRFAAIVAAAEREACAKLCDSESERGFFNWKNDIPQNKEFWNGGQMFASQLAEEIRARGEP